jgi:two-component system, chemotaxis family, sensor histidine kinase and response regulator PixL
MPVHPDIRDQAYQFFIEEAPDLLQVIETGLLTLSQERSTSLVHSIMRAAHSIKGGAASVELDAIATLAHRLETIFKALYNETVEIDTNLESQLLQAYDCLRLPLIQQIREGYFDAEHALVQADSVFSQIEDQFGDVLAQADTYIPSSADLGVDMTKSIFEVDVQEGLERLAVVVAHPQDYEVAGELRAQAEVFAGFAELLNQVEFGAIAKTTLAALKAHPERALEITQLALADFERSRQAVLAGNTPSRSIQDTGPSSALVALTNCTPTDLADLTISATESIVDPEPIFAEKEDTTPLVEDIFGCTFATFEMELNGSSTVNEVPEDTPALAEDWNFDDIFSTSGESPEESPAAAVEDTQTSDQEQNSEKNFSLSWTSVDEQPATEVPENTQTPDQAWNFEEIFSFSPEDVFDSTAIPTAESGSLIASEGNIDSDAPDSAGIIDVEWVSKLSSVNEELGEEAQEEVGKELPVNPLNPESSNLQPSTPQSIEEAVQSIEQIFDTLPSLQDISASTDQSTSSAGRAKKEVSSTSSATPASSTPTASSHLSVRVDSERLEQINNLVGELAINRNSMSLQNEQLQAAVRELLNRFAQVQNVVGNLQELSNQMLIAPERFSDRQLPRPIAQSPEQANPTDFDSLELDSYGVLYSRLQGFLEDMMQLEEAVDDIVLFSRATDQTLEQQRQKLTQLRDQLMWARMLPLGEVLNRFPRMLRDFSTTYHKPVNLKLSGTGVLVDKAVLEKLYDPLLHLLRNAFDHGIEVPQNRRAKGKPEQGQIEIRAYYQGSQTVIEVRDDGQGLNIERISRRALEMGLLSVEQLATISNNQLFEVIFEPGFSTATQVSELSGRGVGLDVVRSQMRSLKGTITVTSSPGVGTTFTLRLPLTLTIAKLLVCFIGSTALALPSDSIEEIIIPKAEQIKYSATQRFLYWRGQVVPAYRLSELLEYNCPLPDSSPSKVLLSVPSPKDWALPMLVFRQKQQFVALEIDRLVTEQELVIKPFGDAIAPPSFTYGCTILADGCLVPVLDTAVLLDRIMGQGTTTLSNLETTIRLGLPPTSATDNSSVTKTKIQTAKAPTILVVDDAVALRRTLALSLERAGCRVLQARDGREAIEQLQQSSSVDLVVCDIEMPNMNGFEFLSCRRQDPHISKIPVVMLTSRSNDKHRWLAMQLGATAYFTKPYLEQEFVGAIKHIIGESTPEGLPALQPTL